MSNTSVVKSRSVCSKSLQKAVGQPLFTSIVGSRSDSEKVLRFENPESGRWNDPSQV